MNAEQKNRAVAEIIHRLCRKWDCDAACTLRRAEMTLHRWAELECGDSDAWKSWGIERDETTDIPYMCIYPHSGKSRRYRIPDREKGALRRIAQVCGKLGLYFYHQTDPRGCALYVAREPMTGSNYSSIGRAVCA